MRAVPSVGQSQSVLIDRWVADAYQGRITFIILTLQKWLGAYLTLGGLFRASQQVLWEIPLWEWKGRTFMAMLQHLLEALGIGRQP